MKRPLMSQAERRRARQFATLVDGGRVRAQHDLQPLAHLARRLRPPPVEPMPEFRAYLRDRLIYAATETGTAPPALVALDARADGRARARPWKELVATAAALSLVTGAGAAAASTRALPGDGLYPLKRSIEAIQISLSTSEEDRAAELLNRAEHRLAEAERLAVSRDETVPGTQQLIEEVLAAMQADVLAGSEGLFEAYVHSGETEALVTLDEFVVESRNRLAALFPELGTPVQRRVEQMLDNLAAVHAQVSAVTQEITSGGRHAKPAGATPDAEATPPADLALITPRDGRSPSGTADGDVPTSGRVTDVPAGATPERRPTAGEGPASVALPPEVGQPERRPQETVPVGVARRPDAPPETVAKPTPDLSPELLPREPVLRPGPHDRPNPSPAPPPPASALMPPPAAAPAPVLEPVAPPAVNVVPPVADVVPPADTLVPPAGNVIPPAGNVIPPADNVIPPADNVIPPADNVIPPAGTVIPPAGNVVPPADTVLPPAGNVIPPAGNVIPPAGNVIPPAGNVIPPADTVVPPADVVPPGRNAIAPALDGGVAPGPNGPVIGVAPGALLAPPIAV